MKAEVRTGRTRRSREPQVPFPFPDTESSSSSPHVPPLALSRVLSFSFPALGAVLADPLMSLVDTACVGQVSSIGLAALGPNTAVFGFVSMVFQFFTVSTTAMVSRAHDRGDAAKKSQCVSDALSLALLCGTLSTFFLLAFGSRLLEMLYTPKELMGPALEYMAIRALAVPATLVTVVATAASLGQRDSRAPLRVSVATTVLNACVNAYVVLGPPALGIVGSAFATCVSQYVGAVLFYRHLTGSKKRERLLKVRLRFPSRNRARPFLAAGAVLTARSACVMTCYSLATAAASSMGTLTVAAHQVLMGIMTVAQFCPEPLSSCAQSTLASVAPRLRDRRSRVSKPEEVRFARRSARLLIFCGFGLGCVCAVLTHATLVYCPQAFSSDPHVVLAVRAMSPIVSSCVLVYSLVCVTDGLIFASGRVFFAAAAAVLNLPVGATLIAYSSRGGFGLIGTWYALLGIFTIRFAENAFLVMKEYDVFGSSSAADDDAPRNGAGRFSKKGAEEFR